ncbi:putative quinol monooxygenase [Halalkalibacter kiskunsagensis]|uniref:Quinol monooxygenase n=1 Tax=Halalkalibacter kiskunsagensis TaxID=1548599 RepID=A0ABV6KJ71_9BACI
MHMVHVAIHVKEEFITPFKEAIKENASHSIQEEGVIAFDVLQDQEDNKRFTLVEIYKTPQDQKRHRETDHFLRFKSVIPQMLAEPYTIQTFDRIFSGIPRT